MEKYNVYLKNASDLDVARVFVYAKDDADADTKGKALVDNCRDGSVKSFAYEKMSEDYESKMRKHYENDVLLTSSNGTTTVHYVKDPQCKTLHETQEKLREMSFFLGGPVQVYSEAMDFTNAVNAGHVVTKK